MSGSRAHAYTTMKRHKRSTSYGCPWPVCSRCGLVLLKNDQTRRVARASCGGREEYTNFNERGIGY